MILMVCTILLIACGAVCVAPYLPTCSSLTTSLSIILRTCLIQISLVTICKNKVVYYFYDYVYYIFSEIAEQSNEQAMSHLSWNIRWEKVLQHVTRATESSHFLQCWQLLPSQKPEKKTKKYCLVTLTYTHSIQKAIKIQSILKCTISIINYVEGIHMQQLRSITVTCHCKSSNYTRMCNYLQFFLV